MPNPMTGTNPSTRDQFIEGLAFDDVLLVPRRSDLLPREVDVDTRFSRNVPLNIPLASAAMGSSLGSPMTGTVR